MDEVPTLPTTNLLTDIAEKVRRRQARLRNPAKHSTRRTGGCQSPAPPCKTQPILVGDKPLTISVPQILDRFVEAQNSNLAGRGSQRNAYGRIDIAISRKEGDECGVRLTNYGPYPACRILDLAKHVFRSWPSSGWPSRDTSLAIVRWKCKDDRRESVYDVRFAPKYPTLIIVQKPREEPRSSCFREYLSFEPKVALKTRDKGAFAESIVDEVVSRQRTSANVKFVCRVDGKIIYNNRVPLDDDYASCQILTSGLTAVLKQSVGMEFRESCFSWLKVNHSGRAELALMVKLLPMIDEAYAHLVDSEG
ncbi:hypothetical protein KM043_001494 [Ampulex compressa]|nr:hypothetical protein KM043_001494 [Ampulex compressa]